MALRELCQAIDQITEPPITVKRIKDTGELTDAQVNGPLHALTKRGVVRIINPSTRPFCYEKTVDSLTAELDAGRLAGLFGRAKPKGERVAVEPPPPPPEEIEIDPTELLAALDAEDFGQLIGAWAASKAAESGPLKEQLEKAQQDIRYAEGQRVNSERLAQSRINELNEQLRAEREVILNLRAELNQEKGGRVMREQAPRIVLQRNGATQMEHGGSGIPLGSRGHAGTVMHKKPHTGHAPAVVVYRKKKG